jgi:hypothetical protein
MFPYAWMSFEKGAVTPPPVIQESIVSRGAEGYVLGCRKQILYRLRDTHRDLIALQIGECLQVLRHTS